METRKLVFQLLLFIVLTVIVIHAYEFIPAKQLRIFPSSSYQPQLFSVPSEAYKAHYYWSDEGRSIRCDYPQADTGPFICGIDIYLSKLEAGKDLSGFETMEVEGKYTGDVSAVRFFMRNYNDAYSTLADNNSSMFLSTVLYPGQLNGEDTLKVAFQEFSVAEWWLDQRKIPQNMRAPAFDNVLLLGFDFGPYIQPGSALTFSIKAITFKGVWISRDAWYLGILYFWLVTLSLFTLARASKLFRERDKLQSDYKRIERLSLHDHLTGVYNRFGLEREMAILRDKDIPLSMILIDIDFFKQVNDAYGHDGGDQVLRELSFLVQSNIRESDVFARWGGEEFLLLHPESSPTSAAKVAEKLRQLIARERFLQPQSIRLTASFGYGHWWPNDDFVSLFRKVDASLYRAKQTGRNRCNSADESDALIPRVRA